MLAHFMRRHMRYFMRYFIRHPAKPDDAKTVFSIQINQISQMPSAARIHDASPQKESTNHG
jgi:hypothetical protein